MSGNSALSSSQLYQQAWYQRQKARRARDEPPDAITDLSPEDLAYIAGLVDGKAGSIYVSAVGPHRERTVYPIVALAMSHREVIEWLIERLDCGGPHIHNRKDFERRPGLKPLYRIHLYGRRAKLLCEALLPYLRVKAAQARLVLEFPVDARAGPGQTIDEGGINEIRFRLRDAINSLNHAATRRPASCREQA